MRKQVGNIEVEVHEAMNCADPYVVYLSVRTSTVKQLNLSAADARDLVYALQCALGQRPALETKVTHICGTPNASCDVTCMANDDIQGCCEQAGNPVCGLFVDDGNPEGECVACSHQQECH